MTAYKRVLIVAVEVHDGLGGVFYRGDRPVMTAEFADFLIKRGQAAFDGDLTPEQAKEAAHAADDAIRQRDQKERAEAVMKRHDSLEPEERIEEAFPEDKPEPEQPSEAVVVPMKRGRRRKEGA